MIESGERWWHVKALTSDLDPKYYLVALVRAVVDGGRLPTYARTAEEMTLLATSNVTTLAAPRYIVCSAGGYNSGNLLIGKHSSDVMSNVLMQLQLPHRDWTACSCSGASCFCRMR